MPSLFASNTTSSATTPRRLARYGLYVVGAMVALWVATQAAAMRPPTASLTPPPIDSTAASPPPSAGAPGIEIFTWGNAAAVLLLLGGGAYAFYLRRQYGGASGSSRRFHPVGRLALGQSKELRLVACGGEVLLLGVTDEDITLLKTYSRDAFEALDTDLPPEDDAAASGLPGTFPTVSDDFSDVLNRFAQRDAGA